MEKAKSKKRFSFKDSQYKQVKNFEITKEQVFNNMKAVATMDNVASLEIHDDKYRGTVRSTGNLQRVYVLVSCFYDEGLIPVQLEVKEFYGQNNKLYVTIIYK
ncbi:hypothetical protein [Anaerovorax odorimutans]|nr:hypothetical protein [Anaerovorax odorimutans]